MSLQIGYAIPEILLALGTELSHLCGIISGWRARGDVLVEALRTLEEVDVGALERSSYVSPSPRPQCHQLVHSLLRTVKVLG
jgi:hypothetical protein